MDKFGFICIGFGMFISIPVLILMCIGTGFYWSIYGTYKWLKRKHENTYF